MVSGGKGSAGQDKAKPEGTAGGGAQEAEAV